MKKYKIIVAGHACLDLIPAFTSVSGSSFGEILSPGAQLQMGDLVVSPGGPVSNTGMALQKLGVQTMLCARVGDDWLGEIIAKAFEKSGCNIDLAVQEKMSTSYTLVLAPPSIDRVFLHFPGPNNLFRSSDVSDEDLRKADHIHLGYPPLMKSFYEKAGDELATILGRAKEAGLTTSLDMCLPDPNSESGRTDWKAFLANVLPQVDIFLPSIEETFYFFSPEKAIQRRKEANEQKIDPVDNITISEFQMLGRDCLDLGAGIVVLKSGHRGMYVKTAEETRLEKFGRARCGTIAQWADKEFFEPAYTVDSVASATGAGDSSIAGFLKGFFSGADLRRTLKVATAVGAQNVTAHDAISGIKDWEGTQEMISSGKKSKMHLEEEGWFFDTESEVWECKA